MALRLIPKRFVLFACFFISLTVSAFEYNQVEEVIAQGLGKDVPDAAQNAAQNALVQVVGSFMDSTKILEKQLVIQDGLRKEVSRIDTNIKEYSQGSIQSFEVLEVGQSMGLTQVTAKVSVRVEDFKAYVRSLAGGEVEVQGESLFAQASTQSKQTKEKAALLYENILQPIASGQVLKYDVSSPLPLQLWLEVNPGAINVDKQSYNYGSRSRNSLQEWAGSYGIENIFALEVEASLDSNFNDNMLATLEKIAAPSRLRLSPSRYSIAMGNRRMQSGESTFRQKIEPEDIGIAVNGGSFFIGDLNHPVESMGFLVSNVKTKLIKTGAMAASLFSYKGIVEPDLEVVMLDEVGEPLQRTIVARPDLSSWKKSEMAYVVPADDTFHMASVAPWLMLSPARNEGAPILIFQKRKFIVFVAISQKALSETRKIRVNLVEE